MNRYFTALTDWNGPNKTGCCERLALFLQNEGLATFIQQRLYGGAARAYGLGFEVQREELVDDDSDQLPADKWLPNPLSGYDPLPVWGYRRLILINTAGVQFAMMNILPLCSRRALIQTPVQYYERS